MKIRLPKGIMALLLATMVASNAIAVTIAPTEIITVAAEDAPAAILSDSAKPAEYTVVAKDGDGTATITGNVTKYSGIYVREGELLVGDGNTPTNLKIDSVGVTGQPSFTFALNVAGKDARVVFNNASYGNANYPESVNIIGGMDGNGELIIDNGSNIDLTANTCTLIGLPVNGGILTLEGTEMEYATTTGVGQAATEENRYKGTYTEAADGSGKKFGRGVVTVKGESTLSTAYADFKMGEGELNVQDSSTVYIGKYFACAAELGAAESATSVINVTDAGKVVVRTVNFCTNTADNTNVIINVSGEGSEFIVNETSEPGESWSGYAISAKLGTDDVVSATTTINVTKGAAVDFKCQETYLGSQNMGSGSSVMVNVDKNSSLVAKSVEMSKGAAINNAGSTTVQALTLNGGEIANTGTLTVTGTLKFAQDSSTILNLADANTDTAIFTLGNDAEVVTGTGSNVTLTSSKNLKAGSQFILFNRDVDLSAVTLDGNEFEVEIVDGKVILTLENDLRVVRDPLADVLGAAAWGVQKSSHAFTGTLWGGRTNAVILNTGTSTSRDEKGGLVSFTVPTDKTLAWGTAYGQFSRIDSCCDATGADFNIYGAAIGVEHQFAGGSSIGAAIGYDWGKVSPFRAASVDQESMHAAVYGRAAQWILSPQAALALDLSAAVGQTESELPVGDVEQDSMQLDARVSYIRSISDKTSVSAFAGLQYYAQGDDATANVEVGSAQYLRTLAGVGINHALTSRTTLFAEASVYNDAMRHNPEVMVDGFSYGVANPGRLGGTITAGAAYELNANWTLRGSYSFDAAKHSTEHSVNAGAIYKF